MQWPSLYGNPVLKRLDPLEEIVRNRRPNVLLMVPDWASYGEALEGLREAYQVAVVTDLEQASNRIAETDFHLVLTPVRLNGHTSIDVVRMVRDASPYSKVLVVGVENEADRGVVAETLSEGAIKHIKEPYDRKTLEAEITSAIGRSPPFPIVVGGHFCVGKTEFSNRLVDALNRRTNLAEVLIPNKSRDPRPYERVSVDYVKVSPEEIRRHVREGKAIPYRHGEGESTIPLSFLGTLSEGRNVVIPTEINALVALKTYFRDRKTDYRLISFLLHCHENHARGRLFTKERYTPKATREIADDLNNLVREVEYYRDHAAEFRHVLRNDNIPGVSPEEAISRLVSRALEILRRESSPRYGSLSDARFREVYVQEQLGFLFGQNYEVALENVRRGKPQQLPFDKEELEAYSARTGIPMETVKAAADRKVVVFSEGYGIYSVGLNPLPENVNEPQLHKRIILDLLEVRLGAPQYREDVINLTPDPHRFSLTRPILAFQDFYISFGLFDPPKAPPRTAPLHSLAFVGLSTMYKGVNLVPVEYTLASKVIQNNGGR